MSTIDDSFGDARDRPHSIDLTFELERQLEEESLPPPTPGGAQSLDPQVIAHIVSELRLSLAEVTRQRDELEELVSHIQARDKDFTDTLMHMMDKCSRMQEELDTANSKAKDDENTISVLRTKVEESRRALMRLQSEGRRHSQVLLGTELTRATLASLAAPQASKRASFVPLTGSQATRAHASRRVSSISDSGFAMLDGGSPHGTPGPTSTTFSDQGILASRLATMTRPSGVFGRASPTLSVSQSEESVEVEMLRKELVEVRAELDEAKHELNDANEAREASEMCAKVLRVFIEEHNVGSSTGSGGGCTVVPPTLPGESKKDAPAMGGWGFKLWRTEGLTKEGLEGGSTTGKEVLSPAPRPLSMKLGEFFGTRRFSVSSTAPAKLAGTEREGTYNGLSDTSSMEEESLAEPVSPASEVARANVLIREGTGESSGSASPEPKTGGVEEGVFTLVAI